MRGESSTPLTEPPSRISLSLALRAASGPVPTMAAAWLAAFVLAFFHARSDALLIALGFVGATLAGLVGLGGAVVMIPLLLYVPPLLGQAALDMHTVTGISMVQVAAAGIAAVLGHLHYHPIRGRLVLVLGSSTGMGSLAGAALSRWMSSAWLTGLFALLAFTGAVYLFLPQSLERADQSAGPEEGFNVPLAAAAGVSAGALSGMVGAGGGILLIPFMIYALKIPLRSAISASVAIVVLAGTAGLVGKAVTGQVDWLMGLALVTGALPGARLGATLSQRTPLTVLGKILGGLIGLAALGMWWDLLH